MKKILAVLLVVALALVLSTLIVGPAVYAMSSVIGDPKGDAEPGYQDIVQAKVTEQRDIGTIFLSVVVASPVPAQPSESALYWSWHLDTDPNTSPYGWPADYVVHVHWNGSVFEAFLFDRITLNVTYVPFSINGASVKAFVDLSAIGEPSSFYWVATTKPLPGTWDSAPDSGWETWSR